MMDFLQFLAQAEFNLPAPTPLEGDPQISGQWIIHVIGAIATGAALFWGKTQKDQKNQALKSKVQIADQPVGVSLKKALATVDQVNELESRIEAELTGIKTALKEERSIARVAQGNLHARLDKVMEAQAEARGELKQINQNVERLLERGMKGSSTR